MNKYTIVLMTILLSLNLYADDSLPALNDVTTLTIDDLPIATVLAMIAEEHGLDIIVSGEVAGNISIRLENVKVKDALDAILMANGYNYYRKGNILIVKPLTQDIIGETISSTVELDNISPGAAVTAAKELLSPRGKIVVIEETGHSGVKYVQRTPTRLSVIDIPEVVQKVVQFLESIDIPEEQLSIHVKIIETNISNEKVIGLNWPTSLTGRFGALQNASGSSTSSGATESEKKSLGRRDVGDNSWEWGTLSVDEVSMVLDFLQQNGNSRLVSDPRITALNNHQSEIKVTTIVPIQTINRFSEAGSTQDIVTFQDEEVGITLKVVPHITKDGNILLDVNPVIAEIIGYSGPVENQKPITSERSVTALVRVKDGETAVLGGLLKENEIETTKKVAFLGSIPILGHLFRHSSREKTSTDLLILITPTILEN